MHPLNGHALHTRASTPGAFSAMLPGCKCKATRHHLPLAAEAKEHRVEQLMFLDREQQDSPSALQPQIHICALCTHLGLWNEEHHKDHSNGQKCCVEYKCTPAHCA